MKWIRKIDIESQIFQQQMINSLFNLIKFYLNCSSQKSIACIPYYAKYIHLQKCSMSQSQLLIKFQRKKKF